MPTIALTGNFGMGKTTVLQLFNSLGAYTIDIDDVVHTILDKPSIANRIIRLLGSAVQLNSKKEKSLNRSFIPGH
jgi:dephospho-CoA kinase